MNNDLSIVIDPGHGGEDPGAVRNDLLEKDYNLLISQYMYERFQEIGIPVAITRNDDTTLSPTERVNDVLESFGNNSNVVVLSNHLNAGGGTGAEVIYALRNNDTLAKNVLDSIAATGQPIRKYYQRRLPSDTSKDYYFIHRNTGITQPLLIEYGFIDNDNDVDFLRDNYKELAEAVIRAVSNYGDYNYVAPEGVVVNTYVVQVGDNLYSIARNLNTTVEEIKTLNNLTNNTLNIGQILRIPSKIEIVEPINYINYTVKSGDNLYAIARRYNVTVAEIQSLNNLTSSLLKVGQILRIPTSEAIINEEIYTVKKGDSLYKIANKFGTTVDNLIELNNLTSNVLTIGQILKIKGEMPTPIVEETYVVKFGDSLYKIAKQFNTSIDKIKSLNNLTSNLLSIGQILKLPQINNETTTYVVQAGDNLYSIARKLNTTVDNLKALNNLTSNNLSVGQILIIK